MLRHEIKRAIFFVLSMLWLTVGAAAETDSGGELFNKRCGACHQLPDPTRPPPEGWEVRLKMMAPLARLNPSQKNAVLRYLSDHSQVVVKDRALTADKQLFEQTCSSCHTTDRVFIEPMTKEALRHVIHRMQAMDSMVVISDEDASRIVTYLLTLQLDGKQPATLPESADASDLFAARCLACHSKDRIIAHLEDRQMAGMDWTHIVSRMQAKAPQWIAEDEALQIVAYLRSYSAETNAGQP